MGFFADFKELSVSPSFGYCVLGRNTCVYVCVRACVHSCVRVCVCVWCVTGRNTVVVVVVVFVRCCCCYFGREGCTTLVLILNSCPFPLFWVLCD